MSGNFDAIDRLYGRGTLAILREMHVCIIGLGGVGSWAAEALARTGVGKLTLIDFDIVEPGNINRQVHALTDTLSQKKIVLMGERIHRINPDCECHLIDDYINRENLWEHLSPEKHYDYVIDAIDSITFKADIIYFCKRNKIPVITTGGAGGITDPTQIMIKDLSRTSNDALAAKVRSRLRSEYGYTKNTKRYFGVECVFSPEQKRYPKADGSVCTDKPGIHGVHLDCTLGYGSASFVTSSFGMVAASRVIQKHLSRMARMNAGTE